MVVMSPKDENELRHMLKTAIEHPGPIALRYPRGTGTGVPLDDKTAPIEVGKAELVCEGQTPDDLLIIAIGRTVEEALKARRILNDEHDLTAAVINARFVKPLDIDLIGFYAARTPYIITVEENTLPGGFGSAVMEALSDANISGFKMKRLGITDVFVDHGPQKLLRRLYGVDAEAIVDAALKLTA
jgi:1-deoxy-D-xylulose-5-phosphate synthase